MTHKEMIEDIFNTTHSIEARERSNILPRTRQESSSGLDYQQTNTGLNNTNNTNNTNNANENHQLIDNSPTSTTKHSAALIVGVVVILLLLVVIILLVSSLTDSLRIKQFMSN